VYKIRRDFQDHVNNESHYDLRYADAIRSVRTELKSTVCSSGMHQQQPGSYALTYQFLTDLQTFD